jgi:uncharacterized YigZ family protein
LDTFYTISQPSHIIYKEKGSKFLSFAYPVENEKDIKECLDLLHKKYYDATHHCYAYLLGKDKTIFRANDDGEPNGTAGLPILGQIRSKGVTNVLVVVVRYFGGTKLGASGLVNAYKIATSDVLAQAEIIEKIVTQPLVISFDYVLMNEVMRIIKDFHLKIESQVFDNQCKIHLQIRENLFEEVSNKFLEMRGVELSQ